jgi:hypothetical protein
LLLPPIIVLILGRKRVFSFAARRFDLDKNNLQRDGAFIAALLDQLNIGVGQVWWIYRGQGNEDVAFTIFDRNRHFRRGIIKHIDSDKKVFSVKVESDLYTLPMGDTIDSTQLLHIARENLRCIDFQVLIDRNLFANGSVRGATVASFYDLSRPVRPNESIDYFISHSWHDDADLKYKKMCTLGVEFKRKYGYYPTFWFDKVFIDQNNIGAGLKVLPINVMACRFMLVVCGKTYASRLWCVWELCTLFSFAQETALNRVVVLPVMTITMLCMN